LFPCVNWVRSFPGTLGLWMRASFDSRILSLGRAGSWVGAPDTGRPGPMVAGKGWGSGGMGVGVGAHALARKARASIRTKNLVKIDESFIFIFLYSPDMEDGFVAL
jgi:hypothetical protein